MLYPKILEPFYWRPSNLKKYSGKDASYKPYDMCDIILNQYYSDCYSCESSFSSIVKGSNTMEPLYDDIKELDKTLCWETYEPQADTSVTYTGTSGSCEGKCYASAYKYKGTIFSLITSNNQNICRSRQNRNKIQLVRQERLW